MLDNMGNEVTIGVSRKAMDFEELLLLLIPILHIAAVFVPDKLLKTLRTIFSRPPALVRSQNKKIGPIVVDSDDHNDYSHSDSPSQEDILSVGGTR